MSQKPADVEVTPKSSNIKTPEALVSFAHVFKAKSAFEGQPPKYSVTLIFNRTTDLSALKKAVFDCAVAKFGPKEKWPKGLRMPFRNGDEKQDLQGYAGNIFINVSSKTRPGIVNQKLEPIAEEDGQFYSGCYARASLSVYAYDKAGNKGISFGLQNLQKLRDGTPFSGRKRAEDEFEAVEDTSENQSSYTETYDDDLGL